MRRSIWVVVEQTEEHPETYGAFETREDADAVAENLDAGHVLEVPFYSTGDRSLHHEWWWTTVIEVGENGGPRKPWTFRSPGDLVDGCGIINRSSLSEEVQDDRRRWPDRVGEVRRAWARMQSPEAALAVATERAEEIVAWRDR